MQMLLKCQERGKVDEVEDVGVQKQQKRTDDRVYVGKKEIW